MALYENSRVHWCNCRSFQIGNWLNLENKLYRSDWVLFLFQLGIMTTSDPDGTERVFVRYLDIKRLLPYIDKDQDLSFFMCEGWQIRLFFKSQFVIIWNN